MRYLKKLAINFGILHASFAAAWIACYWDNPQMFYRDAEAKRYAQLGWCLGLFIIPIYTLWQTFWESVTAPAPPPPPPTPDAEWEFLDELLPPPANEITENAPPPNARKSESIRSPMG